MSTAKYSVVQATDEQREVLRGHAGASFTVGIMDTLVLKMKLSQVRSAHEDPKLQEVTALQKAQHDGRDLDRVPNPAEVIRPPAIIKRDD